MAAAPGEGLPQLPQIPARGVLPCIERGCSRCCHDTEMLLTEDDVARITAARPGLDFAFVAHDGYLQLRTRDGPPSKGGSGRPCVFLDPQGLCSIHAVRPEGCRLYPAMWTDDLRRAELDAEGCPYTDGFLLSPMAADAVRRLAGRLHREAADRRARAPP